MKKSHVRLNLYERGIVAAIASQYQAEPAAARELVVEYIDVIRKLGAYDNCEVYAQRLTQARSTGLSAVAWLDRIKALRREALKDRGIELHAQEAFVR